jgi:hypothetical protein
MNQLGIFLLGLWQHLVGIFSSLNLQLVLLIGSGLVAVALLVLSLTSWGQARPVWKCVVLSVAAHVLLMGYAYGTHLIFQVPAVQQPDNPVRINLVDDEGDVLEDKNEESDFEKPWEQFVNQQFLPDVEPLDRPLIDSLVVIERKTEIPELAVAEAGPAELDGIAIPPESTEPPPLQDDSFEIDESAAAQEIEVQRPTPDSQVVPRGPEFDFDPEVDRPEIAADLPPVEQHELVPTEPTEFDKTPFASELVNENALIPVADPVHPPRRDDTVESMTPLESNRPRIPLRVISAQKRLGDGKPLPEIYKLRAAENRLMVAERRGGSIETEKAVQMALQWLAANQTEDGSWDPRRTGGGIERKVYGHDRQGAGANADSGITALAVMAFMAGGHTHLEGTYQENVQKGLEYLIRNQTVDGNLAGNAKLFARMYCHSMSLLAISEALALTGDARLVVHVQRGVDYSVFAQNKTDGGWRYQPGDQGDMSQFGWQVLAMHSANDGGIYIPEKATAGMRTFLESCCSGVGKGLASYRPNHGVSTTMTAEALVCRYYLQDEVSYETQGEAVRRVLNELPSEHHINLYYWYYGTMAMYHTGGNAWEQWNRSLKTALLNTQVAEGSEAGSWAPNGLWAGYGGRVYSTAMSTLCLEVYYRYLPMYEVTAAKKSLQTAPERHAESIIHLR